MNYRILSFILIVAAALIICSNAAALTITGTVTDTNDDPVPEALVTFTDESNPDNADSSYTDSNGSYEIHLPDPLGVKQDDALIPGGFTLHQNYPNPFNSATVIPYTLDKAGFA